MKYVYLIQSLENGYYKIGISKTPNIRLKQLSTGNPSKIKLVQTYYSKFPHLVESSLHQRYAQYRKEGEWFELSIEVEVNFLSHCSKIEENIIFLKKNGNVFI